MENYEIMAPTSQVYATAKSWNEAVDKAVDLSLRWGVLFRVRRMDTATGPFQRERLLVFRASMDYIELARTQPKSMQAAIAKRRFETAKRKLDTLMQVHEEFKGSDFAERHSLNHPVKAFRSDSQGN